MKRLAVLLLLLAGLPVAAGELGLTWDPVSYPHPITYEVFRDGIAVTQTVTTKAVITVPDNCVSSTYTVTAAGFTPAGPLTSQPSAPIISMARPAITSILFNAGGVHQIIGDNFPTNVQVEVDGTPSTATRLTCQLVEIPTTTGTPTTVKLIAPSVAGDLSVTWTLPPPVPPVVGLF